MTRAPVHGATFRGRRRLRRGRPDRPGAPAHDRLAGTGATRPSTDSTSAGCTSPGATGSRWWAARPPARRGSACADPSNIFGTLLRAGVAFDRNQRDGANVVAGPLAPTALAPARRAGDGLPVAPDGARLRPDPRPPPPPHRRSGRRLGRLVRRRRLPEVHPLDGVQRRPAVHQRSPARRPRTRRRCLAEARYGLRWLDEDVGRPAPHALHPGRDRLGQPGRHVPRRPRPLAAARRPTTATRGTPDRFVSHRPVFARRSAGPPDQSQPGRPGRRRRSPSPPRQDAAHAPGPRDGASCGRHGSSTPARRRRTRRTRS